MVNPQLSDYIKDQLSQNIPRDAIVASLKSAGWNDADIGQAMASFSSPTSAQPSSYSMKNKKLIAVILILILAGIGGVVAYANYTGAFVSFPKVLAQAVESAKATTSASFDATVNVDFSGIKDTSGGIGQLFPGGIMSKQFKMTMKGTSDSSDPKNPKISSLLTMSFGPISVQFEARMLDNILYARMTQAPAAFSLFANLDSYEGKWFSYSNKLPNGELIADPLSTVYGIDSEFKDKLTQDQKDHLSEMFRQAHLIKMTKKLPVETIGDQPSYHFAFELDREGMTSYFQNLTQYIKTIGKNDSSLSTFDLTSLSDTFDQVKDFSGEIWIGREDKLTHKVMFSFGISPDESKPDEKVKITMVAIVSDWNKPVSIVAPEGSTSFTDLISASIGDARQKSKEAAIKANLSNMRAQAELFYDQQGMNAYLGFCSSNELLTMRQAIEGDGGTKFYCKDASQAYAAATKFPGEAGYWCVDSTGASKSVKALPINTVCPIK